MFLPTPTPSFFAKTLLSQCGLAPAEAGRIVRGLKNAFTSSSPDGMRTLDKKTQQVLRLHICIETGHWIPSGRL